MNNPEQVLRDMIAEVIDSINRTPTYQPATEWADAIISQFKRKGGEIREKNEDKE